MSNRAGRKATENLYEIMSLSRNPLEDLTDGMYEGDPARSYSEAQDRQRQYLLDEVDCKPGSRLLDVGCGNGTLLDDVRQRDAVGVGITLSPSQAAFCQARGLDARVLDYKDLLNEDYGSFDAIVANGSIEHFVTLDDALNGRTDDVYREMFSIFRQLLKPGDKLATTIIHFNVVDSNPRRFSRYPLFYRKGTDQFNLSTLFRGAGAFYPTKGQLESCAEGSFKLTREVDGTEDYGLTSTEWMRMVQNASRPTFTARLKRIVRIVRAPQLALLLLHVNRAWCWQFEGNPTPTSLLRQTWEAV